MIPLSINNINTISSKKANCSKNVILSIANFLAKEYVVVLFYSGYNVEGINHFSLKGISKVNPNINDIEKHLFRCDYLFIDSTIDKETYKWLKTLNITVILNSTKYDDSDYKFESDWTKEGTNSKYNPYIIKDIQTSTKLKLSEWEDIWMREFRFNKLLD